MRSCTFFLFFYSSLLLLFIQKTTGFMKNTRMSFQRRAKMNIFRQEFDSEDLINVEVETKSRKVITPIKVIYSKIFV